MSLSLIKYKSPKLDYLLTIALLNGWIAFSDPRVIANLFGIPRHILYKDGEGVYLASGLTTSFSSFGRH